MPTTLANYIAEREVKPPFDVVASIVQNLKDLNPEWLLTGRGNYKKNVMEEVALEYVYFLPVSALGGTFSDFNISIRERDCERIISPVKGAQYAISVSGDSMAPEYPSGSRVLIKQINDNAYINWGSTYVIDTCNGIIIKNVLPVDDEPDKILCESINPKFPPFIVSREDIYGFYKVMLCLSAK